MNTDNDNQDSKKNIRQFITNILFAYFLIQIPISYFLSTNMISESLYKSVAFIQLILPPLLIIYWGYSKGLVKEISKVLNFNWFWYDWLLLLIYSTSLFVLANALSDGIFILLPESAQIVIIEELLPASIKFAMLDSIADGWILLLGFGFLIPSAEELLFRGLGISLIKNSLGINRAVLFTAVYWAFLQMNPLDFLFNLIFGVVLAYLMIRSTSLMLPVGIHSVFILLQIAYVNIVDKSDLMAYPDWKVVLISLSISIGALFLGTKLTDYYYLEAR